MKGKALLTGAGLALIAGLTMGATLRPDLAADNRPEGPQAIGDWQEASTGPFDDRLSSYNGQLPAYVTGTDWTKAMAMPISQTAYTQPLPHDDSPEANYTAPASFDEASLEAATPVSYPSQDGGRDYAAAAPNEAEPQPAAHADAPAHLAPAHFDADVAPEATGDTTPAQG